MPKTNKAKPRAAKRLPRASLDVCIDRVGKSRAIVGLNNDGVYYYKKCTGVPLIKKFNYSTSLSSS